MNSLQLRLRIFGFALFTLCAAGCGNHHAARLSLERGEQAYTSGDFHRAVTELSAFLADSRDAADSARAYYVRGQAYARAGKRAQAYADLRIAVQKSGDHGELRWRAGVALGSLYFEDSDWAGASAAYEAAAAIMPRAVPRDTVCFRLGQCAQRLGRWSAAQSWYKRVVAEFPRSIHAESARRQVESSPSAFSIQCGVFGDPRNAEALTRTLQNAGLQVWTRSENRSSRLVQVVYVGRYATWNDANRALGEVRRYSSDAIVWP